MNRGTARVAALLFFSGACALAYQTTWLRQFRLVFGASTYATAAVLAIFMGGLGAGSAILGKRADLREKPLAFYGILELLIAATAALSQPLLALIGKIYFAAGGSVTLGIAGATIVRLVLATLVLGAPTFLMGGTLPAAARAVETIDDPKRRRVALLYATNTLGAVTGTLLTTFYMLEHLGNRATLFCAVALNVAVGAIAIVSARTSGVTPSESAEDASGDRRFVFAAAALTGFAFLLMELVWYRMLGPLLGATTFMFGLILATALLGIGLGGAAYSFWSGGGAATTGAFALTCAAEAAAMIFPFALGDRLAMMANLLRALGRLGFSGNVLAWSLVTTIVVFPAAFISGIQFPLLIALLGRGRDEVGRHVGAAYAWNTAGAIAGSLAGGFGLIPLLSAPGTWRLVAVVLAGLAGAAIVPAMRRREIGFAAAAAILALGAVAGTFALGPSAVWRHSSIGVGRAPQPQSRNEARDWMNERRRALLWDADGRESSIGIIAVDDYAFYVNGKSDGSARADAGTQVMSGMLGAFLHPNPKRALVVGLGTGSTAGWLAAIPTMTRVDAVEIEPLVVDVARQLAAVNHDAMDNPKLHTRIADAREVLLATHDRYDVIFSEPSNPYRAGIASLFTVEYYRAVDRSLAPGGVFVQWMQAYAVDNETIGTIYKTLTSVFPNVETWRGEAGDLLLVARREPAAYDAATLRARLAQPIYRDAAHDAWRVEDLEGFFTHLDASSRFASEIARVARDVNTDDRTVVEFGFARSLGTNLAVRIVAMAQARNEWQVDVHGPIDWNRVQLAGDGAHQAFVAAVRAGQMNRAIAIWDAMHLQPLNSDETAAIADATASIGRADALGFIAELRRWNAAEADALTGIYSLRTKQYDRAAAAFTRAFTAYRSDPWPLPLVMGHGIEAMSELARADKRYAETMWRLLERPFVAGQWEDRRTQARIGIALEASGCSAATVESLRAVEPWPAWNAENLRLRRDCYARAGLKDLAEGAARDYEQFVRDEPSPLLR